MPGWVLWFVLAAILGVGEMVTLSFFLGPIALAAVLAGVVSLAGGGAAIQIVVFVAASLTSLWLLRPIARRHLRTPASLKTGAAALPGTKGVVVERVDDLGGRVKIGGEVWSARAFFEGQTYEPGARVEVAKIEGATALVFE